MSARVLTEAIENRLAVSFRHEGRRYVVEPYSIGYNQRLAKSGGPMILRAWYEPEKTWLDFRVKHMSDIVVTDTRFAGDKQGHVNLLWVHQDIWGRADGRSEN
jgi:hypothetical protein